MLYTVHNYFIDMLRFYNYYYNKRKLHCCFYTKKPHINTIDIEMEKPTWTVVQFTTDNTVEAVPSDWIEHNKCY